MQVLIDTMRAALARIKAVHEAATQGPLTVRTTPYGTEVSHFAQVAWFAPCASFSVRQEETEIISADQAGANAVCFVTDRTVSDAALAMFEYELAECERWLEKHGQYSKVPHERILRLAGYIAMFDEPTAAELAKETNHVC